jgi:hypothetical protein
MFFLKASNASLSCGKHLAAPPLAPFRRMSCRGSASDTGKKLLAAATTISSSSSNLEAERCIVEANGDGMRMRSGGGVLRALKILHRSKATVDSLTDEHTWVFT